MTTMICNWSKSSCQHLHKSMKSDIISSYERFISGSEITISRRTEERFSIPSNLNKSTIKIDKNSKGRSGKRTNDLNLWHSFKNNSNDRLEFVELSSNRSEVIHENNRHRFASFHGWSINKDINVSRCEACLGGT